jgi:RNA polymerase sigma-32 factor
MTRRNSAKPAGRKRRAKAGGRLEPKPPPDAQEEPPVEAESEEGPLAFVKGIAAEKALLEASRDAGEEADEEPGQAVAEEEAVEREPETTAVVPTDALTRYFAEIRRFPLLTREEEYELAVRYHEHGDLAAAYRLVTANLRLVVKIAMEYQSVYMNLLDLIQEGNIGLMQAVKQFNPYREVKLSSYAAWWIRAFILRYIINNWRLVKIGTTRNQRKLFFNLNKERERLEAMGYDASPRLIAANLDVSEKEVEEMSARMAGPDMALDEPVAGEGRQTFLDFLTEESEGPEGLVAQKEARRRAIDVIRDLARTLPKKERAILDRRLLAEDPATLQEIGDSFGITKERTRQLEARLIKRLRDTLRARFPDLVPQAGAGSGEGEGKEPTKD